MSNRRAKPELSRDSTGNSFDSEQPVAPVRFVDDAALVEGVRAGNPVALREFHDRFARSVQRILWGVLGPDRELADLHHDVFVRALHSIERLEDPASLSGWMSAVAVHTARACLEKRISRRRWSSPLDPDVAAERSGHDPGARLDAREALRAIHAVLDQLSVPDRIAFSLRYIEGLELSDVARACEVSLATIKRRLARAEARFAELAQRSPVLRDCLEKGASAWIQR
jgi:RNA polymerase sigma-70 factor (ECF subfamily)